VIITHAARRRPTGWRRGDGACGRRERIPGIEARRIPGFRSIDLVRRERERDVEFMTLMWFDSLDAVKEPFSSRELTGGRKRLVVIRDR
jgi:hypothetical protein